IASMDVRFWGYSGHRDLTGVMSGCDPFRTHSVAMYSQVGWERAGSGVDTESVRSIALQFPLRWKRPKFNFIAIAAILFVFMGIAQSLAFANSCCIAKCQALNSLTDDRAMCPTWCESPAYQAWSADLCAQSSNSQPATTSNSQPATTSNSQPATTSKNQTKSSASRTDANATTKTQNSERIKKQAKSSMQPAPGPPAGATAVHETSDNANAASGSPTATPPTPPSAPTESPPSSP